MRERGERIVFDDAYIAGLEARTERATAETEGMSPDALRAHYVSALMNWSSTLDERHNLQLDLAAARTALAEIVGALQMLYECNVWYGSIDDGDKARLLHAKNILTTHAAASKGGDEVSETIGALHRAFSVGPSCVEIVDGKVVFNWNTLAKILDEEYLAGQRAMRERAAQEIAEMAKWYSTEFFPEDGASPDCIAAKMGRHASKVWAEMIRALAPEEEP